jgi:hypothetical protein
VAVHIANGRESLGDQGPGSRSFGLCQPSHPSRAAGASALPYPATPTSERRRHAWIPQVISFLALSGHPGRSTFGDRLHRECCYDW